MKNELRRKKTLKGFIIYNFSCKVWLFSKEVIGNLLLLQPTLVVKSGTATFCLFWFVWNSERNILKQIDHRDHSSYITMTLSNISILLPIWFLWINSALILAHKVQTLAFSDLKILSSAVLAHGNVFFE